MELGIRSFGPDDDSGKKLDFSHLESNPKFNEPEGGVEPQEPVEGEPQEPAQEPSEEPQVPQEPNEPQELSGDDTPSNIDPQPEGEPQAPQEPVSQPEGSDSSLNPEQQPEPQEPVQITEERILETLSEKLGREIKSFDDLTPEPVEIDPQVKAIDEWRKKTGRPIEDFFKFQKDYNDVSDLDVAREFLQIEYPTLSTEEVNLELQKFQASEDDLEDDVARKNLELKKYATKGRQTLESFKAELGEPSANMLPPEIQEQLNFAKDVQSQIDSNKKSQEEYFSQIQSISNSTESMKLNLSEDLSINFNIDEAGRKELPNFINDMPHWRNDDGSWNHKAVIEDGVKIKYFDKMLQLAYEQGQNSGKDTVIKDAKNSTLSNPQSGPQPDSGNKGPKYENFNLEGTKQTLKFGK
jgi:hypothetical protein